MKGNYDAKFLKAIYFAFKKYNFNIVPKAGQLQAIHAVVTGNDVFVKAKTGFANSVFYMSLLHCCSFNMFGIFFDPSLMLIVNQSFLLRVAIEEDQMDDIRKYEISCLKSN